MRLKGKKAVVTGGGTGIGLGIARALQSEGCKVVIAGRREEKLAEAVKQSGGDPPLLYHAVDGLLAGFGQHFGVFLDFATDDVSEEGENVFSDMARSDGVTANEP